jgi:LysR family transcriptional regulator, carnitine catabolism transcriptional activator
MDRRHIEYFLGVARHGSFTAAAAALHVAQPSLSQAVRALEREVHAPLFHRLGRGVRLTAAGEALIGPAEQILRCFASATAAVREVSELVTGRLELVALTTLTVDPLAPLVGAFRRAHSGVDVRIADPARASAVAEMVRSGRCELGLADFSVPADGLSNFELPAQEVQVVLPPDELVSRGRRLRHADVAALDLIATPLGTSTRTMLEEMLAEANLRPRVAVETPHRAAIVPLVLAGAGCSLLPKPMADDAARHGACVAGIDPPLHRRIRLLWCSGPLSRAAQAFIDLVAAGTLRGASPS